jgi:signal transduction histidine kinase
MKYLLVLLLITHFCYHCAIAQDSAKYQVRFYNTENGLPSNGIKGIQLDKKTGFLWIGTEAGIVRFNGIDFITFSNKNTPIIGSERIRNLIRNNNGEIFAIDDSQNQIRIQRNKLVLMRHIEEDAMLAANIVLPVSDTLFRQKITHPILIPGANLNTGRILPVGDTNTLFIFDKKVFDISLSNEIKLFQTGNDSIKTGFKLRDKIFLVSDENKIFLADVQNYKLSPIEFNFPKEFKNNLLQFFWEPGMENPVIVNRNRAWVLECDDATIYANAICNVIPTAIRLLHLQYSKENNILFLGTDSKGLVVIGENRVEVLRNTRPGPNEISTYYSQIELPGDAILTGDAHVISRQQKKLNPFPIKKSFSFSSYVTSDSILWYSQPKPNAETNLLNSYNLKTGAHKAYDKITVGSRFGLGSWKGDTYIMTDGDSITPAGFGILQNDSLHLLFPLPKEKFGTLAIFDMIQITPGIFTVVICEGLVNYDVAARKIDTLLTIPGSCIRAFWKYEDYLFIGTYGHGYYIYKNGKLKEMPLDKNGYLSHVHCFMPDKFGYCWMSTNRGLFKSKIADLLNAFEKDETQVYYHYFGKNDGIENTEMNGGCAPCAIQMRNGTLSFPTMDGLLWVNPETSQPILPKGDIFIDDLYADNKKVNIDTIGELKLSPTVSDLTVYLGYPAWSNKENLYIQYDLDNSGTWKTVDIKNEAVIHLFGLGYGKHQLQIRKIKGFGPNNYSFEKLEFTVKTPWYLKWWSFVILAVLAFGIGRFFIQLRIKQYRIRQEKLEKLVAEKTSELQHKTEILEKNDSIKTRLISIISHDIVTPLKFLSVAGKNLVEKRKMMSEELQNETIGEMTNTSQELQLLTTNILNWIKFQNENRRLAKENFHVHELVNQVFGVLNSMAHQKGLRLSNQVNESLEIFQFAEPTRILIYNLVSNAINFSETGNIVVSSAQKPGNLIISVKDEGVGMDKEQVNNIMAEQIIIKARKTDTRQGNGLGYLIIKDLVKMIGAELKIESEKGSGTLVSVIIPYVKENEDSRNPETRS